MGLAATSLTEPQFPPQPKNTSRWFQGSGSFSTNSADPGPAPSPFVVTDPPIEQYAGVGPSAWISVAEAIDTPATRKFDSVWTAKFGKAAAAGDAENTAPADKPTPMAYISETRCSDGPQFPRMRFSLEPAWSG